MFSSQCANPQCSIEFDYRSGRLFCSQRELLNGSGTVSSGVEHFWLGDGCSSAYALVRLEPTSAGTPLHVEAHQKQGRLWDQQR